MKKYISFLIFITILFSIQIINAEKWVGQIATYQLLDGEKTESGEPFKSSTLSAACNGFKLGSTVEVINIENGQKINVTVNDRIKGESKYFMLLTPEASKQLGFQWETGLAVVNAQFSDVNSTDILPITGLVSEAKKDSESLKRFPDIEWPETVNKNSINDNIKNENLYLPEEALINKPDKNDSLVSKDQAEDIEEKLYPEKFAYKTPKQVMENSMIDKDISEIVKELEEPEVRYWKTPQNKDYIINEDEKTIENEQLETPEKKPNENPDIIHNDISDDLYTQGEIEKEIEELPFKILRIFPEKKRNYLMDDDEQNSPSLNKNKFPYKNKNKYLEDYKNTDEPEKTAQKNPNTQNNKYSEDYTHKSTPEDHKSKTPDKEIIPLDDDKIKKDPIEREIKSDNLLSGKIYIRFFTTKNEEDANLKKNFFDKIFGNIKLIKVNDKFILFTGPIEEKYINKTIRSIRSFGYKDAYIIKVK